MKSEFLDHKRRHVKLSESKNHWNILEGKDTISRAVIKFHFYQSFLLLHTMAPHSSTFAWKIPWMEEPGRLQSMGLLRVGHDWATSLSLFTLCIGEGNGNPLQCSCLENPRDGGAWWAAIYGVTQSRTQLKQLSSSSSSNVHYVLGLEGSLDLFKK